ncbi:Hypothetical predicted protein [Prunus dulcis]|uniref:Uncharacterized protein n=1 Tax=Prunus dulcis TaxID=3755 RepID=A0A5E4E8S2_PRUDU|nr:Hypothetical predicted protein [Prunus dulcis]
MSLHLFKREEQIKRTSYLSNGVVYRFLPRTFRMGKCRPVIVAKPVRNNGVSSNGAVDGKWKMVLRTRTLSYRACASNCVVANRVWRMGGSGGCFSSLLNPSSGSDGFFSTSSEVSSNFSSFLCSRC